MMKPSIPRQNQFLYGVAYYDEYMPHERLADDVRMMRDAGINVVRIAESTWSTHEPQPGVFEFKHVDRVLDAMGEAGISVIVGTPTYAIPSWLARLHPEVMVTLRGGRAHYGNRQVMDITSPAYLHYAERIIRKLIGHVQAHPAVIGYQLDNETKHYGTAGPNVQQAFVRHLKQLFNGDLAALNRAYGLDYWSNRIDAWEDVPSMVGTVNASLGCEFSRFQRGLVTEFLAWQAKIVRELCRPDQFLTQNFDGEFKRGIQPEVDHFKAGECLDVAGFDVYHDSQDKLTGHMIAFCGDLARSIKGGQNYLVLETQAQGWVEWTPYPGQLRLQAFSHLASGANMVAYWHWSTVHNSVEVYWRGLLGHDFSPNPTYQEACVTGRELTRVGPKLVNLKKQNRVAVLVSNESLTAMAWYAIDGASYNDVVRLVHEALYRSNIEADFLSPDATAEQLARYALVVVPALYAAPDALLERLNDYVRNGGHAVFTFRTGYFDEHVKARTVTQPGVVSEACGITFSQFTKPASEFGLRGDPYEAGGDNRISAWMDLLIPGTAEPLAYYDHPVWGQYAAVTRNGFGKGVATYIGAMTTIELMRRILLRAAVDAGVDGPEQRVAFPVAVRKGTTAAGKPVRFYLNYSSQPSAVRYAHAAGVEILSSASVETDQMIRLQPWDVAIVEEN